MKTSAFVGFVLYAQAISAFLLHGAPPLSPRSTSRSLGVVDIVVASDPNPDASSSHRRARDGGADHPSSVAARRAFLARGIGITVAPSLPCLLGGIPHASADETSGPPPGAAVYAYRSGGLPSLRPLGLTKLLTRYEGYVEAPKSYPVGRVAIAFDFPSDWLQLDRLGGGIQYVDQRNGDKLYVLRATLPDGDDLRGVDKRWFADAVLSPMGDVARSGVVAEGGRISGSRMIVGCDSSSSGGEGGTPPGPPPCVPRRRLVLKYDAVTGSGVQTVERRGLIESYQVGNDAYMMLTTSNAVKFEQKASKERETVDNIVGSFRIGQGAFS